MDEYGQILTYLNGLYPVSDWKQIRAVTEAAASLKPQHWKLPLVACHAVGGAPECALPAAAAVACMHMSIVHIDDMLDAERQSLYRQIGMAATANVAAALQALSLEAVLHSDLSSDVKLATLEGVNLMALGTAYGQHLDIQNPVDEAGYWQSVRMKSSPFFGAALYIGALSGNATVETADTLRRFGHLYGEVVQIYDDLKDAMTHPASPDWLRNRSSLPILYAQRVAHPERNRFEALRNTAADPSALAEAQLILIRCGAVSYCVHQLIGRHRKLQRLLKTAPLTSPETLESLLSRSVAPVRSLLKLAAGRKSEG